MKTVKGQNQLVHLRRFQCFFAFNFSNIAIVSTQEGNFSQHFIRLLEISLTAGWKRKEFVLIFLTLRSVIASAGSRQPAHFTAYIKVLLLHCKLFCGTRTQA